MSERMDNEQLSSYFDGEATPEERAAIEEELGRSQMTRRELDEIRALSEALKGLPKRSAPAELRAAVLQAAERATLLENHKAPASVSSPKGWGWQSTLVTLATTVAALLVMVFLADRFGRNGVRNAEVASGTNSVTFARSPSETAANHGDIVEAEIPEDSLAATAFRPRGDVAAHRDQEVLDAPVVANGPRLRSVNEAKKRDALRKLPLSGEPAEAERWPSSAFANRAKVQDNAAVLERLLRENTPADTPAEFQQIDIQTVAIDELNLRLDRKKLNDAEVGQIVEALETSGNGEIAVVQLTVIDRRAGLESLQLLLAKNQVAQDSRFGANGKRVERKEESGQDSESDELIGVYVEATEEQLAATFKELNEAGSFRGLVMDRALQLAQRDGGYLKDEVDGISIRGGKSPQKPEASTSAGKTGSANGTVPSSESKPSPPGTRSVVAKGNAAADDKSAKKQGDGEKEKGNDALVADGDRNDDRPKLMQQQVYVSRRFLTETRRNRASDGPQNEPGKNAAGAKSEEKSTNKSPLVASVEAQREANRQIKRAPGQPLQVLFVIVNAENGAGDSSGPALKAKSAPEKKPNDGAA